MTIQKKVLNLCFEQIAKISPVQASKILFYKTFRKRLNLKNPITFNEKLMWLKLNEDDTLKAYCADKYLVRNYVSKCGYADILNDLYQVYENAEEINFNELPDKFVMKCSHASGFNVICTNKVELDKQKTILQLKKWMETDYGLKYCEPHYSKIKPRIIVERFLKQSNDHLPVDYMIHCFHGVPQIIEVGVDDGANEKKYGTLNCDWDVFPYLKESETISKILNKPEKMREMLEIAKVLSKAFTYVRVDLYYSNHTIYFGEMTFTPAACLEPDYMNNADQQLGKLLDLTVVKSKMNSKTFISKDFKVKVIDLVSKIWPMVVLIA